MLDERRLIAGLRGVGIDLAPFWEEAAYARQRDADIAAWAERRLAAPLHPDERATVDWCLALLSLQPRRQYGPSGRADGTGVAIGRREG